MNNTKISYDKSTGLLLIENKSFTFDADSYSKLLDELGDHDFIQASELGKDICVMAEEVFILSDDDLLYLSQNGHVYIQCYCSLKDFIDENNQNHIDFLNWYYAF